MATFPNATTADGIWSLKKQRRAVLGGDWPGTTPLVLPYPNSTAASDVWSLKDLYKAKAGDNWPPLSAPVDVNATGVGGASALGSVTVSTPSGALTLTSIGTFVTQSSTSVTSIDLTGVSTSDQLIIVYGTEIDGATPVTSATLGGYSASLAVAINSTSASSAVFFMPATNVGGSSGLTFACTAGSGTQFRAAVSIFSVNKASALNLVDTDSATTENGYSGSIDFASGGVLVTGFYDDTDPASVTMIGVDNTIFEEMGSASSDFYIGYSSSGSSGSATHSIGYTATATNVAFVGATFT